MGKFAHHSLTYSQNSEMSNVGNIPLSVLHCISADTKALKSFPFSFCINCVYAWSRGWEWFDKLFSPWPTKIYDGLAWHIFTTHAWCTDRAGVRTRPCTNAHIHAADNLIGALTRTHVLQQRTQTLKAFYILDGSVSMTKCAPSHTVLQIEPWFPLASHTQLPVTPHMSDLIASASTHMHTHMCSQPHTHL